MKHIVDVGKFTLSFGFSMGIWLCPGKSHLEIAIYLQKMDLESSDYTFKNDEYSWNFKNGTPYLASVYMEQINC